MKKVLTLSSLCLITLPSSNIKAFDGAPPRDIVRHPFYSPPSATTESSNRALAEKICADIDRETESPEERIAIATQKMIGYENLTFGDFPPSTFSFQTTVIEVLTQYIAKQKTLTTMSKSSDEVFEEYIE